MLDQYTDKNIHIVGISGAEGSAVALYLPKKVKANFVFHDFCLEKDFKKNFFSFHDAYLESEKETLFQEILKTKFPFKFGDHYLEGINEADVIFVPQSWFRYSFNDPLKECQKKLTSVTKLFIEITKAKVIGVTGTSGKSTTSALVHQIIKTSGRKSIIAGNERHVKQQLEEVSRLTENDFLVLEISNRQLLLGLEKSPNIAIVTNVTPNHLDDHDSFEEYIKTKKKIFRNQQENDILITNYDSEVTRKFKSKGETYLFSGKKELISGVFLRKQELIIRKNEKEYRICEVKDLKIKGNHNIENAMAAGLAAFLLGVSTKIIRKALKEFKNLESRLEPVVEINGVEFINDSKSSNPVATMAAINSFKRPMILIAGGSRKQIFEGEFEELAKRIVEKEVKGVILIGSTAKKLERVIWKEKTRHQAKKPLIRKQDTLQKALKDAVALAETGDVVIFSPACESFGLFKDYRERSKSFIESVKKLSEQK